MKQFLILSCCLLFLASCSNSNTNPAKQDNTESAAVTTTKKLDYKLECKRVKEETGENGMDAGSEYEVEDVCTYGNLSVKTTYIGDDGSCKFGCSMGSYFIIENGKEREVKLEEFFKNKEALLKKINAGLKQSFIDFKKENEEDYADCFEYASFETKAFDDLRLVINEGHFSFNTECGIDMSCYGPVGREIDVSFEMDMINAYL